MSSTSENEEPRVPVGLIYGERDRPPTRALVLLAIQHIFLMSSTLVLPVALVAEIGGSAAEVRSVVGLSMIACGIGTVLQALRWRWVGSGFLCPNLVGPNFFTASAQAAWLGGLPLMRGMTIFAGLVEVVFARLIRRVRCLFPPEITGLVVLMVALSLVPLGTSRFLGINFAGEPIDGAALLVSALTLLVMAASNIWGGERLRLYGVLVGMVVGYSLSLATGILTPEQFNTTARAPWIAAPLLGGMWEISFRWSLVPTFAIVSVCGALKSFGNLIMCEKINTDEWHEPDIRRVGNGLMADAACVTLSGLIGGMASDTSASNVAYSKASGATSRVIGVVAGSIFIALGFFPKLGSLLAVMPAPVMGAILVFVTCFMILSALQIILTAEVDARLVFVIGIPLVFGLSLDVLPVMYNTVPAWLRPLTESPLAFSTVLAVTLNQVLSREPGRLRSAS